MHLNQITLPATDIEASFVWYQKLGFKPIVNSDHYKRLQAPDGGATLSLSLVEQAPQGPGIKHYLECESAASLDAKVQELQAQGFDFEQAPTDQTWLWREAWLCDPSGNQLCLYFAGKNRLDPPWRVKD